MLAGVVFALVLGWSRPAAAQFTAHALGFEAGYFSMERIIGVEGGPVVGIQSTLYIDGGFDLYFRANAGVHKESVSQLNTIGVYPALGVRYLLSEDIFRPYLGGSFALMHFFGTSNTMFPTVLFSVSPQAGFEYYFDANAYFGLQAEYHRILVLNGTGGNAFAGIARVGWGF